MCVSSGAHHHDVEGHAPGTEGHVRGRATGDGGDDRVHTIERSHPDTETGRDAEGVGVVHHPLPPALRLGHHRIGSRVERKVSLVYN